MTIKQYRCTLLADVIINQKNKSTQNNETLDYIPGAAFLGVVAKEYANFDRPLHIFHSGDVCFGDAHPSLGEQRGIHIPNALYRPKLNDDSNLFFVYHQYNRDMDSGDNGRPFQLKQQRSGYYVESAPSVMKEITVQKSFATKSAQDYRNRRAKDKQMFGYESITAGVEMLFEVTFSNKISREEIQQVEAALVGKRHIGRSRSAQYGLVDIQPCQYQSPESYHVDKQDYVCVYADSRLCFIDPQTMMPTLQPSAEQLGLDKGAIVLWDMCQIRTFQYAPWNFKRQAYDPDRFGIEKGSVFVVQSTQIPATHQRIGLYKSEGFGKVIYNPHFLLSQTDKNGLSIYAWESSKTSQPEETLSKEKYPLTGSALLHYLARCQKASEMKSHVLMAVDVFIRKHGKIFSRSYDDFASQWGSIRDIGEHVPADQVIAEIKKYLSHGIAKEKWEKYKRCDRLITFLEKTISEGVNINELVINLASEMAKETKRQ